MFRIIVLFLCFVSAQVPSVGAAERSGRVPPERAIRPVARMDIAFTARWDHLPKGRAWSRAALTALRSHADNLPDIVPRDIETWCPRYPYASQIQREAFWVGLVSTLSKHESTWRSDAVGGGGLWYGLLQILPSTAEYRDCRATTPDALKNGAANLACGLRIMSKTVERDVVVSYGMRGVAADWGPFHSERKRQDMIDWMRKQSYCKGMARSLRPEMRPVRETWAEAALRDAEAALPPPSALPMRPKGRPLTP